EPGPVTGGRRVNALPGKRPPDQAQVLEPLAALRASPQVRSHARGVGSVELAVEIQLDVRRVPQMTGGHARPPATRPLNRSDRRDPSDPGDSCDPRTAVEDSCDPWPAVDDPCNPWLSDARSRCTAA